MTMYRQCQYTAWTKDSGAKPSVSPRYLLVLLLLPIKSATNFLQYQPREVSAPASIQNETLLSQR